MLIGAIQGKLASGEAAGTLPIPFRPYCIIEFIAFPVFTLVLLCDTIKSILAIFGKEVAEDIMQSWS